MSTTSCTSCGTPSVSSSASPDLMTCESVKAQQSALALPTERVSTVQELKDAVCKAPASMITLQGEALKEAMSVGQTVETSMGTTLMTEDLHHTLSKECSSPSEFVGKAPMTHEAYETAKALRDTVYQKLPEKIQDVFARDGFQCGLDPHFTSPLPDRLLPAEKVKANVVAYTIEGAYKNALEEAVEGESHYVIDYPDFSNGH